MNEARRVDGRDDMVAALVELFGSARQRVRVHAPLLDGVWADPRVTEAARGFVTARSQRELQLLLGAEGDLPRDHAALVALHQRLPSLIQFRTPQAEETLPEPRMFVLSDIGGLLMGDVDPRAAGAQFSAESAMGARALEDRFEQAWLRARPLTSLRALGL